MGSAAGRVVVHVGTPKSGTTFLQRALWRQREALRLVDVHLAGDRAQDMFTAAIEVRETYEFWGRQPGDIAGTWARLSAEARRSGGTTVMSHELLGAATKRQAERALAELSGLEVHVLVTARDLGRQLMSSWQEEVKNGSSTSFDDYQASILDKLRRSQLVGAFWRFQNLPGILGRWGAGLPPENIHVVVAPRPGAPAGLLWDRCAEAIGFDTGLVPAPELARSNETLGLEQVAALRRVNIALDGRVRHPDYGRLVKRPVAQRLLAAEPGTRPQCPPPVIEELRTFAEGVNSTLRERGYRVYGDLQELVPTHADEPVPHPDDVPAEAEVRVLATLVAEQLVQQSRHKRSHPPVPPTPPRPLTTARLAAGSLLRRVRTVLRSRARSQAD